MLYLNDASEFNHIFEFAQGAARNLITDMGIEVQEEREDLTVHRRGVSVDPSFFEYAAENEKRYQQNPQIRELEIYESLDSNFRRIAKEATPNLPYDVGFYSASLSAQGDLLSQWRAYCPNGGYALGFNAKELHRIAREQDFYLVKCMYDYRDKGKLASEIFQELKTELTSAFEAEPIELGWKKESDFLEKAIRTFARFSPFVKHKGFKEEEEWRLVDAKTLFPQSSRESQVHYRTRGPMMVPYLELILKDEKLEPSPYDFSKLSVTVGPMQQQLEAKKSVEGFLRKELKVEPRVEWSEIPYRTA